MENKIIKIAVNILIVKDSKLLLGERKNAFGAGSWGLPGGHLEYGESLVDGAKRELMEETGIIADLEFESIRDYPRTIDNQHYIHINFLAKNIQSEPQLIEPDKCAEWKWFPLDKLPENIFISHQKIISAFLSKTNFC